MTATLISPEPISRPTVVRLRPKSAMTVSRIVTARPWRTFRGDSCHQALTHVTYEQSGAALSCYGQFPAQSRRRYGAVRHSRVTRPRQPQVTMEVAGGREVSSTE